MNMKALRNFKRRGFLAAYIGVLGIVGAQREMVWANDLALRETAYGTDFIAASVGGLRNTTGAGINVSGLSGTVNKAYLYWHGPMNSTNPLANATIRVNNQTVTGVNIGFSDDNCWGYNNSQAYRADVTSLVQAERNGTYSLSQYVKQGTNINANGASLLIFYNDGNPANNRDVVIFDGNDSNADNFYDAPGWNVSLSGISYTAGRGYIQLHVSDGQIYEDAALVLDGRELEHSGQVFQGTTVRAANNGPGGNGRLWDVATFEVTDLLAAGSNTLALTHGYLGRPDRPKGDCVSLIVAAIDLPAGAAPPANDIPVVTGTPLITVNSSAPIIVQANATDADGDPLSCTIAIDGVVVSANTIPAGSPTTGALTVTNAFGLGQHAVVFTAHDGVTSDTFTTVVSVVDNTPPVIAVENFVMPSDLGRTTAAVDYRSRLSITDDFPGATWIADRMPGSAFPIGTSTVNVTAVDASANRAQRTFTITVTDSLPPAVNCPPDLLRPTDPGASNAIVRWTCSAMDNLPGCTTTCTPPSGSAFQIGITTVVCSARDAAGNTANCMFTVMIVDREAPVLTVPTNIVVVADHGQDFAVVNYTTTVKDNVPGATVVCTPPPGSPFLPGATLVNCTASDAAGNTVTNAFTVTVINASVRDSQPPVITVPSNVVVPTDPGRKNAMVNYTVTVTDNQPGAMVVCLPPSGSAFAIGTTTVVCTASDAAGNRASNSFTVTVEDREKPVLIVPANLSIMAGPGQTNAVAEYIATATDNSGSVAVVCAPPSGKAFPLGVTAVTCTAVDDSGNTATGSFTVTVIREAQPPDCGCIIASRSVLWPMHRKMVPVSVWMNFDKKKKIKFSSTRIVSVTSNEPETGLDAADIGPDWEITNAEKLRLKLRAECDPNGSGRVYTITVEAKDPQGHLYLCKTTVTVPLECPKKKKK